jgi:20S proteasome alpha/beta subunit
MTLIAGFRYADGGVVLCADREESRQIAKRSIDKIFRIPLQQAVFLIAGAGRSSILANTFMRLETALKAADTDGSDLFKTHGELINNVLRGVHQEFIWGYNDEPERTVALIVAVAFRSPHSIPFLYGTDSDVLYPHQLYGCAGVGEDLAYYFADKLYHQHLTRQAAALLAAFIFREVSQSVSGVGLGADMMVLAEKNCLVHIIPPDRVRELEDNLPKVADAIAKAWNEGVQIPDWLAKEL